MTLFTIDNELFKEFLYVLQSQLLPTLISQVHVKSPGALELGGTEGVCPAPPPNFFQRTKCAIFLQVNVAVNTILASKAPFSQASYVVSTILHNVSKSSE